MRTLIFTITFSVFSTFAFCWGNTGHRVTGYIANQHLTKKARMAIQKILGQQSLAMATNWMDEIKSDSLYDYADDWHWVSIEDGETYEQSKKNPNGDLIMTIERIITELKSKKLSLKEEAERLKMLIHLIGDIHQPLHVGYAADAGGNDVKLTWFGANTNLHRVWDHNMIDESKLSYTELAESLDKPDINQIKKWQASNVRDWANESIGYRKQVYNYGSGKLGYKYSFHAMPIVRQRLLQAGIRLAGVLNDIYK
jgi:hypothetical protein